MTLHTLLRGVVPLTLMTLAVVACTQTTDDNFPNPPPSPPDTCTASAVSGCSANARGFSCSTTAAPDVADTNLVCSNGAPQSDGSTEYCCIPYAQTYSLCAPNHALSGCDAPSVGFSCTGETAPNEADSALTCATGPASDGAATYCCAAN